MTLPPTAGPCRNQQIFDRLHHSVRTRGGHGRPHMDNLGWRVSTRTECRIGSGRACAQHLQPGRPRAPKHSRRLNGPIAGFYDPTSYTAPAIDVSLFVLLVGEFLGVVTATGAINTHVARAIRNLEGREKWMIPIMMAAGYDALTGVAIIMLGAGVGVIGSTINPFSTAIASDAARLPFTQGMTLRFVVLGLSWLAAVTFVMRYAKRVRKDA
jgi:uncharacterized ion transporter superfamily protein YfcC